MKLKKLLSTFLAVAVTVSTLLPGAGALQVEAAAQPVKTFSFENSLSGSTIRGYQNADYSGSAVYADGKEGRAIQLGDYGLRLNVGNVGENYSVAMWVKPSANQGQYGSLIYSGSPKGATELWTSLAADGNGNLLLWSNGDSYSWTQAFNGIPLTNNEWTFVTLTQAGNASTLYINGNQVGTGSAARPLMASGNDIYIGVNHWDGLYQGLVDEVRVYDKALTSSEIYELLDTRDPDVIFDEKGFAVDESLTVYTQKSSALNVELPVGVKEGDAKISYASENTGIATVDAYGTVFGVASGQTTITTTVTVGNITKTAQTRISVQELASEFPVVAQYEMNAGNGTVVTDTSGYGNHATIVNPAGAVYVTDGDRSVLDLNSSANNGYVTLPLSLYEDLTNKEEFTIEATFARTSSSGNTQWLFCFGSIPRSTGTNYLFYSPFFDGYTSRAGIKDSSTERLYTFNNSLSSTEYYTASMVFDNGTITLYVDGVPVGPSLASGYSMASIVNAGTQNNILGYIGRSCWSPDPYFAGRVDSFKVYDRAMSREEVQVANPEFEERLENDLNALINESSILGLYNESIDNIKYDMNLIDSMDSLDIVWTSSRPDLISTNGIVTCPEEDTDVTLTATVRYGVLSAQVTFDATVKAFDLADLKSLIKELELMDKSIFKSGYAELQTALANVPDLSTINSYQEALEVELELKEAVSKLSFIDDYVDPWDKIEAVAPVEDATYEKGESEVLFTVPKALENCVRVTYTSDNEEVATYVNGEVKAHKAGTAILTLTVTSNYDGWKMEYGTYVTVNGENEDERVLPFEDVKEGDWFYTAVYNNYFANLMNGKSETRFDPFANLTRAEMAQVLYNMENRPGAEYTNKFPDVPKGDWFTDAVLWAEANGIVTGYIQTGKFEPHQNITREQAALMMLRYARFKGYAVDTTGDLSKYLDAASVSEYATEAMQWAVGNSIISGKENGTKLEPLGQALRAECAVIIDNFMKRY